MDNLRDQLQRSLGESYTIQRELGGGGMARVFVAEETSLGRRVVVKLLPDELAGSVSIARFRREISLAARLQHPHIVSLLTAGEVDGLPYYTMPYVEGESLRAKLAHGELSIPASISILRDVAKALEYAHGKGVAHRDIKPDNVLLVGTSAVLADLGVAKAISEAAGDEGLTGIGVSVGTPAYMAPEQAAADPSADLRADVYQFGVMAFEMLAGHTPFAGRGAQATLAAHATEAPPSIGTLRPATPPRLAELVMRCLEKRPADRPQSATEIVHVLDTLGTPSGGVVAETAAPPMRRTPARRQRMLMAGTLTGVVLFATVAWWRTASSRDTAATRSIAILPFENKSGDTAFDYLEDGVTDHVRDALNGVPGLTVRARSSSRQLKGRSARDVGAKLDVSVVLQGTVSRSNSRLHVTTELVRTSDDGAIWSQTFDRAPGELAGIQDTIANAIAGKLGLVDPGARSSRSTTGGARGTKSSEAYDFFLRGRQAFDRFDFVVAGANFRRAVALDPSFARAEGFLAMNAANMAVIGLGPMDSLLAVAQSIADRALARDSTVVEAYVAKSFVLGSAMRFGDAIKPLEQALAIDSSNADVLSAYGLALQQVGRMQEGLVQSRRAYARDPLSVTAIGILGYALELTRQFDDAIAKARNGLGLDPKNVLQYRGLGFTYAFAGRPDSAVAAFEAAFALDSAILGGRSNLVFAYGVAGRWNDVARQRQLLDRDRGTASRNYYDMIEHLVYGENDAAMTSLERGIAAREQLLSIPSIPCDPLFDPLKANPRFDALMRRIGARACPAQGTWPIHAKARGEDQREHD